MPSEALVLPAQTEKPQHYTYLKEFRTQQCPLFLQHKCSQHRPFTCFNWHFMNQRRRRPIRRRDGTFNYSPDSYCSKYDEATGICPDGEDCLYLHRTAGDTERRYHLRYYKTGTCIYETDSKGHCVKNGPHCAFAHGAHDLRPPVYDIRELQVMDTPEKSLHTVMPSSLEKDRILTEDPRWNDTTFVLANYKTEQCKRPPRLCRQGYACPQYHNSRDRRRSPKRFRYRSTPCPNVKHGDDWGDPAQCESGDSCTYCHTRTEQQFHPEIYKSTKCNDMVQTGYCPRGPFCAFAHVEQEMTTQRDLNIGTENLLAAFVTNALPQSICTSNICVDEEQYQEDDGDDIVENQLPKLPDPIGKERCNNVPSNSMNNIPHTNHSSSPLPEPIGKGRTSSTSSSINSDTSISHYQRAPGSEREDGQVKLRQQLKTIENDPSLDMNEKAKQKQNLVLLHSLGQSIGGSISPINPPPMSNMSPLAPSFYPPGETVESVVGNALDDLNLEDFDITSIEKELDRDNDSNSVSSTLGTGLSASGCFGATSVPVTIPPRVMQRGSIGSLSQSPPSPFGSLTPASLITLSQQQQKAEHLEQAAHVAFLSHTNLGKFSMSAYPDISSMPPRNAGSHATLYSSSLSNSQSSEIQKLREEVSSLRTKLTQWEETFSQLKCTCGAWKKENEESARKLKIAEDDRLQAMKHREEALNLVKTLQQELDKQRSSQYIHCLKRMCDLDVLPLQQIQQYKQQLQMDLEHLEKVLYQFPNRKCLLCQERTRTVTLASCNHLVICDVCTSQTNDCPYCHTQIKRTGLHM